VHLLQLLLGAQVVGVSAFGFAAVGCSWVETSVAFAADHLIAVVFLCQDTKRRLDDTTTQAKYQVQCRFFLNVVVRKSTAILKLLASEDQSLLVWRDSLLILNFSFNILDSVTGLDLKGDGLTSKGLHEDLHVA